MGSDCEESIMITPSIHLSPEIFFDLKYCQIDRRSLYSNLGLVRNWWHMPVSGGQLVTVLYVARNLNWVQYSSVVITGVFWPICNTNKELNDSKKKALLSLIITSLVE